MELDLFKGSDIVIFTTFGLAGIKYEQENEDDFKDKQDFVAPAPQHYPPNGV